MIGVYHDAPIVRAKWGAGGTKQGGPLLPRENGGANGAATRITRNNVAVVKYG